MRATKVSTILLMTCCIVGLSVSCVSVPKRNPLPMSLSESAVIEGIPHARYWADERPPFADEWFAKTREELAEEAPAMFGQPHHYLAISGGGPKGAFGAGLLAGWSAAGTRPEFQVVTGISTGALTAPFAYLGSDYDHVLEEMYTQYSTDDLVDKRSLLVALNSDAVASTEKLEALIAHFVDDEVLEALATEARKGRDLYIGTTNLDAQRPVLWRIHAIAMSGHPGALDLIRQIMLASASIPAAFPPVPIDVEAEGQLFDELHVDGGASSQVFLYPSAIDWARVLRHLDVPTEPTVYVIRNSFLDPIGVIVKRRIFPIAGRTISSLIRTQGIGDLYRIYALAQRDGLDFNLAYIPGDFTERPTEQFDKVWMRKLYQFAFEMGKSGYDWRSSPPDFVDNPEELSDVPEL